MNIRNLAHRYALHLTLISLFGTSITLIFAITQSILLRSSISRLESQFSDIKKEQENLGLNLSEELFQDHLKVVENIALSSKVKQVELELESLKNTSQGSLSVNVNNAYTLYQDFQKKLARNNNVKLDVSAVTNDVNAWGALLLNEDFDALAASLTEQITKLDEAYDEYLASLPPPATAAGGGYSYLTVNTEKGTFGVYLIKVPKGEVTVKTIAAIEDDCNDNCATKTLQQYMQENNAWAGMTGSYACPADYASCAGKIWSFDFALYDSNDGKWLNKGALSWNETGMITFSGHSSNFYEETSDYDGDSVSAAVSNFPSLLDDGEVVVDSDDIDSYQNVKGLRGAIGVDDNNIYLAYISGATVIDAAYAMKALGARDALNLDGGGTAAMYINGGYAVGPGRPLANAILLIK